MEAGTGMMRPEVKGCQEPPEAGRDKEWIRPSSLRRSRGLLTPWFSLHETSPSWASDLKNCERIDFYYFKPPNMLIYYSRLRKLIRVYTCYYLKITLNSQIKLINLGMRGPQPLEKMRGPLQVCWGNPGKGFWKSET